MRYVDAVDVAIDGVGAAPRTTASSVARTSHNDACREQRRSSSTGRDEHHSMMRGFGERE